MDKEQIRNNIRQIDNRVARLEKINGEWIGKYGEMNSGIYKLIQDLMDEREKLSSQLYV